MMSIVLLGSNNLYSAKKEKPQNIEEAQGKEKKKDKELSLPDKEKIFLKHFKRAESIIRRAC